MTGFQVSFSVSPRPPRSTSPSYRGLFAAPSSFLRSWKLRKFFATPETLAHNGLVGGSSPSSPTTQSCATGDFLKVYERPRIGGDRCDRSFTETARYSRQVVSAHFSLPPKSRFPETETARGRDSVRMPVTPKEVRASGAAEATWRACRRGGPLPCHEAAAPRWPLSRDRAPGRQARSSC